MTGARLGAQFFDKVLPLKTQESRGLWFAEAFGGTTFIILIGLENERRGGNIEVWDVRILLA